MASGLVEGAVGKARCSSVGVVERNSAGNDVGEGKIVEVAARPAVEVGVKLAVGVLVDVDKDVGVGVRVTVGV